MRDFIHYFYLIPCYLAICGGYYRRIQEYVLKIIMESDLELHQVYTDSKIQCLLNFKNISDYIVRISNFFKFCKMKVVSNKIYFCVTILNNSFGVLFFIFMIEKNISDMRRSVQVVLFG